MAVEDSNLRKLVELKEQLRQTNEECATYFGVSTRTIIRWTQDSRFGTYRQEFHDSKKSEARTRIASLADDVITELVFLMRNAKSDMARVGAAKTLGEWLHLHEKDDDNTKKDDRDDAIALLKAMNAQAYVVLPPPKAGGALPDFVEGEIVEETQSIEVGERKV